MVEADTPLGMALARALLLVSRFSDLTRSSTLTLWPCRVVFFDEGGPLAVLLPFSLYQD